eukprot:CAMPEP_0169186150 /NCGR_PEP_ID=MMETSP1016-20121227/2198_1 /TAXON_ID=342587 /ORGANISM="Karlodinium micrum, Strain CCMP2283" /LENGTH=303 /DNA_ID=CAMNT_0009261945 /DNA_START=153 /DNA_END=1065 /DNA_ORIENTATION=+
MVEGFFTRALQGVGDAFGEAGAAFSNAGRGLDDSRRQDQRRLGGINAAMGHMRTNHMSRSDEEGSSKTAGGVSRGGTSVTHRLGPRPPQRRGLYDRKPLLPYQMKDQIPGQFPGYQTNRQLARRPPFERSRGGPGGGQLSRYEREEGFGGFARNMMRGVGAAFGGGMAEVASVNQRILDSALDAIRDDDEARRVLGVNPTIGSPTEQKTFSKNVNGLIKTKSTIQLPIQGGNGDMWTARVEAEVTNAELKLKKVTMKGQTPGGKFFYIQGRDARLRRLQRQQSRLRNRYGYNANDDVIDAEYY